MDGARLWEAAPFYSRSYAEVSALFDTVYVSMYKMLGGFAGAVLAGPVDVIGEARSWRHRHGGTLVSQAPLILAARRGLRLMLPRIAEFQNRAVALAEELSQIPGAHVVPLPPQTPMMHLYLPGSADALWQAALDLADKEGVWLIHRPSPSPIPSLHKVEISVKDGALAFAPGEARTLIETIMERAASA
jgi:threonine aldolase